MPTLSLRFGDTTDSLFRRKSDGSVTELSAASGLPLGICRQPEYDQKELQLSPSDFVLMFSDGIVEAETAAGEPFEVERLRKALEQTADHSAGETLTAIRALPAVHQTGVRPSDD
jgi:phosphoserine phosphatase RsbU/P